MSCYICQNKNLDIFLDLGHQPPSDAFLSAENLNQPEQTFPLRVFFCNECKLVQLDYAVDPKILFREYVYNSGTNNSLVKNFKELVELVVLKFKLKAGNLAVDVGSNDGTLLENYLKYNIKILGIDPSSATKLALKKHIPTMIKFFNFDTAGEVLKNFGPAKIITATNMFAHVDQLDSFMRGIKLLLDNNGVFISESHYLLDMITKMQYDSIYHEHLRYYSLKSLEKLFVKYGMEIIDAERISTHGGSIRVYAAKAGKFIRQNSVDNLIENEDRAGLYQLETFIKFAERVKENKLNLLKIIVDLKKQGKKIVGIGAPAKGNTLINYCHLDANLIDYLAEKSPLKIGTFSPGAHIPVMAEEKMFLEQPDYGLFLSWNLADELIPKLCQLGFKGQFIVPNPKPKVI